jgi:anti-sigma regulatory factor (Ser/Thr protein kinase)
MEPGDPATLGDEWLRLAAHGSAPAAARRHVSEWLSARHAEPAVVHDLALAVSELAANVVQHSGTAWVLVRVDDDDPEWWTLEVVGGPRQLPDHLRDPARWTVAEPDSRRGGRGLGIVRSVVDEVEVDERGDELAIRCRRRRVSA